MKHLDTMLAKARAAMQNAYAPYSNFKVGVCLRAPNDELFAGCNIENASYSVCQCAEASAIGALITAGHTRIMEAVVIATGNLYTYPCGSCRQRLLEFADDAMQLHAFTHQGDYKTLIFHELLPFSFSKHHLVSL